jgi:transcriptional regulator with XRE-family HTH domain
MPKIDVAAKAWELTLAERVGKAVQKRRKALKWTGVELAEQTAELGYPITRVAISKIEGNSRAGKLDVAELLILAAALDIAPVLLLAPGFPTDGQVETQPGHSVDSRQAVKWFSGLGAELIEAQALAEEGERRLSHLREIAASPDTTSEYRKLLRSDIRYAERTLETLRDDVARKKLELWGELDGEGPADE